LNLKSETPAWGEDESESTVTEILEIIQNHTVTVTALPSHPLPLDSESDS
jgi:hypothetical protein